MGRDDYEKKFRCRRATAGSFVEGEKYNAITYDQSKILRGKKRASGGRRPIATKKRSLFGSPRNDLRMESIRPQNLPRGGGGKLKHIRVGQKTQQGKLQEPDGTWSGNSQEKGSWNRIEKKARLGKLHGTGRELRQKATNPIKHSRGGGKETLLPRDGGKKTPRPGKYPEEKRGFSVKARQEKRGPSK